MGTDARALTDSGRSALATAIAARVRQYATGDGGYRIPFRSSRIEARRHDRQVIKRQVAERQIAERRVITARGLKPSIFRWYSGAVETLLDRPRRTVSPT